MLRKLKATAATLAVTGVLALGGATNASALGVGTFYSGFPSTGAIPVAATAGASRIVINGVHGPVAYNCTTTTLSAGVFYGTYALPATIGTVQPQFSSCSGPASLLFAITCSSTPLKITSGPSAGVSQGDFSAISCVMTFTGTGCFGTLSGAVPIRYTNPSLTAAVAAVQTSGQTLNVSASWCPTTVLSDGPAQLGAPSGGGTGLANLPFTLSGASGDQPLLV